LQCIGRGDRVVASPCGATKASGGYAAAMSGGLASLATGLKKLMTPLAATMRMTMPLGRSWSVQAEVSGVCGVFESLNSGRRTCAPVTDQAPQGMIGRRRRRRRRLGGGTGGRGLSRDWG
jgi:hypothetical protein